MLPLILMTWALKLLIPAGLFILGFRAVRALERRSTASAELVALHERVQAVEDAMANQEEELRRIAAGQDFAEKLLSQRASGAS
jgi:hypothetical protein